MRKHIGTMLSLILFSFILLSTFSVNADELPYTHNHYDYSVIPDAYNTGCKGDLVKDYEFFDEADYPQDEGAFYLNYRLQDKYGTTLENIEFTRNVIVGKANQRSMVFKNCKFTTDSNYSVNTYFGNEWTEDITLTFINCDFTNYASAAVQLAPNTSFINCKFYEAQGDGAKGGFNVLYKNCYFYNIGFADGAHADGIQWTNGADGSQVINCRFDMPYYDKYIPNAAIFFVLEQESNGYDNVFKDIYATGGNYTFYYGAKEDATVIENTTFDNINIGCSYQYGPKNIGERFSVPDEEFKTVDTLFVSSVYQENNKIKLFATNYTNEEKTLICITDAGTEEITIPACPTYAESLSYTSFSQFPFNVEVELDGSEYVVCYSDEQTVENQIRYVNFNEEPLEMPDENYSDNGNVKFKANINSWFKITIPNSYNLTDLSNNLEFTAEGDIAGNEALSITTDETLVLTNDNSDELPALISMNKTKFNYLELKNIAQSAIVIEIEKLPAGRFVGELPIYISIINTEEEENNIITGQINNTVNYYLENEIFTVSGTGEMSDYYYTYENYRDLIKTVVIEDGVEAIGLSSFQDCINLETVYIGNDVYIVKGYAFKRCSNIKSIYMPISVTEIRNGAFSANNQNTTLYYEGTEEQFNQIVGVEHLTHLNVLYEQNW